MSSVNNSLEADAHVRGHAFDIIDRVQRARRSTNPPKAAPEVVRARGKETATGRPSKGVYTASVARRTTRIASQLLNAIKAGYSIAEQCAAVGLELGKIRKRCCKGLIDYPSHDRSAVQMD